jgi:AcrR family transcriptional regulator
MDPRMDRTRQHVLACAREILLARGADAVTYSEVGRVARVSRNTLYRHWPTREKLLADLTLSYYAGQDGEPSAAESVADFLESVRENLDEPGSVKTLSLLISRADHDPAIAQALRHVAQLRQETLSKVTGPLTDAEFAPPPGDRRIPRRTRRCAGSEVRLLLSCGTFVAAFVR